MATSSIAAAAAAARNLAVSMRTNHQTPPSSCSSSFRYPVPSISPSLSSAIHHASLKVASSPINRPQRSSSISAQDYLVKKVNATELDKILEGERTAPVVVDFYATWCGPCILLAQELEQLAVEYGDTVKFVKVDTDEEYDLANDMEIRGLPTMVFVSKDTEKHAIRTEGLLPLDVIRNIIDNEL